MNEGSSEVAARLRRALDLFEAGVAMMRQNLRREFPDASEEEIEAKLTEWLHTRPGAENGDCPGKPRTLSDPAA